MDNVRNVSCDTPDTIFDWQTLLHPAAAYAHPRDVLADPNLTVPEKRAILSSWASDACGVVSMPGLRQPPGAQVPVAFDDIIEALHALDDDPAPEPPRPGGRPARRPWFLDQGGDAGGAPI